jgi:hypothetical protein
MSAPGSPLFTRSVRSPWNAPFKSFEQIDLGTITQLLGRLLVEGSLQLLHLRRQVQLLFICRRLLRVYGFRLGCLKSLSLLP